MSDGNRRRNDETNGILPAGGIRKPGAAPPDPEVSATALRRQLPRTPQAGVHAQRNGRDRFMTRALLAAIATTVAAALGGLSCGQGEDQERVGGSYESIETLARHDPSHGNAEEVRTCCLGAVWLESHYIGEDGLERRREPLCTLADVFAIGWLSDHELVAVLDEVRFAFSWDGRCQRGDA